MMPPFSGHPKLLYAWDCLALLCCAGVRTKMQVRKIRNVVIMPPVYIQDAGASKAVAAISRLPSQNAKTLGDGSAIGVGCNSGLRTALQFFLRVPHCMLL